MYSIHKYAYTSHVQSIQSIKNKHQFQLYKFSYSWKMDLNDHEKMDQWLNQKGRILDADQGQMDSCSFCKHLPVRGVSDEVVKWCVS